MVIVVLALLTDKVFLNVKSVKYRLVIFNVISAIVENKNAIEFLVGVIVHFCYFMIGQQCCLVVQKITKAALDLYEKRATIKVKGVLGCEFLADTP